MLGICIKNIQSYWICNLYVYFCDMFNSKVFIKMTKTEIKDLVVRAAVNSEELANVVDAIFKAIGNAYSKGFDQGKYDPDFDDCIIDFDDCEDGEDD